MRVVLLAVALSLAATSAAEARAKVIDSYCSPTGDYCVAIRKADGQFHFRLARFGRWGKQTVCVKLETRVCRTYRRNKLGSDLYEWRANWRAFPDQGGGRYSVRWFDKAGGYPVGPALHFRPHAASAGSAARRPNRKQRRRIVRAVRRYAGEETSTFRYEVVEVRVSTVNPRRAAALVRGRRGYRRDVQPQDVGLRRRNGRWRVTQLGNGGGCDMSPQVRADLRLQCY